MAVATARETASLGKSSDPEKAQSVEESTNALDGYEQDGHDARLRPAALSQFTDAEIKRTWRKVDLHILPVAVLLYLSSYIDR